MQEPLADLPDDPRLMQAVQEFCAQLEAGQRPNRHEFLRRYPDLAEPLAQCLAGLELVHKTAGAEKKSLRGPANLAVGPDNVLPANPLGDFQIMREIGRGGMGIVYEAVQLSLGRRVALKVLPFAATFDGKHLQRFHNEAQAAAQLHHTNIVPIYYVGSDRGVHFYAMQLIDGHSLAVVIRQIRQQIGRHTAIEESVAGAPRRQELAKDGTTIPYEGVLPLPRQDPPDPETVSQVALALSTQRSGKQKFYTTAARFVMQAAEALDHAHQYGIVHRDIKPANLLVDAHSRLWITDFGLAQFRADANLTRTGDLLGTLRYMSPEQASGQRVLLDHRTDIYSLGATLYELVTLEPMFPEQDHQALLYQIVHDEPRAPRSVDKSVPVDLETI
ncbi:MAG TPA: serine/threonine-protein kinase, partial [Gemmataceae bacterium]